MRPVGLKKNGMFILHLTVTVYDTYQLLFAMAIIADPQVGAVLVLSIAFN